MAKTIKREDLKDWLQNKPQWFITVYAVIATIVGFLAWAAFELLPALWRTTVKKWREQYMELIRELWVRIEDD